MADIRIPFHVAIAEPRLLKPRFDQLSLPQQVALKVMYGCNLTADITDARGFSELDYWSASQGGGYLDELGYLTRVRPIPYLPQEYQEAWGVWGIRGGKTDTLAATAVAYEAVCGGHEAYARPGRPIICFQIAQDTRMAKYSLHSINATLQSMAFLNTSNPAKSWVRNLTADRIELKNGVTIAVTPPTVKSIRGYDAPVAVLDEVGVWYQDADSANPDFEIYDQVNSRQAQFAHPKIIGISSPWNRGGILFKRYEAGTNGVNVRCNDCRAIGRRDADCVSCVVARAAHSGRCILYSTTAISNPIVSRAWLQSTRNKDARAFERECIAKFQDSLSGFLNSALIDKARAGGIVNRPPDKANFYIAAIDPAFRGDAFAFTIVHTDPKVGVVQDYVYRWFDPSGTPLDPGTIFPEIAAKLREYGIRSVHSDQYTIEALQYIAAQHNFSIQEVAFTSESKSEIYGNLQSLLNQGRLSLLDDQDTISELKTLEKRLTQTGKVQISAPEGQHDDMATVIAIAAHEAVWMLPKVAATAAPTQTVIERHLGEIKKRRTIAASADTLDW